jgi:hypothetical protein
VGICEILQGRGEFDINERQVRTMANSSYDDGSYNVFGEAFIDGSTGRWTRTPNVSDGPRINGQGSGFPGLEREGYPNVPSWPQPVENIG